jgi:hypothetical protein
MTWWFLKGIGSATANTYIGELWGVLYCLQLAYDRGFKAACLV